MPEKIHIRPLHSVAEFDECVRLQQLTWGREITVPSAIFVVGEHTGGLSHGAFDGDKIIGFAMAMAGFRDGHPFLHSHMAAVLPEYRDQGIGRRLKFAQREDAIRHGIHLIEWTFDPLELKNAHFNFNRLGIIARVYIPNCYGITDSPLHAGLPTDRLVAEWWLDSPRVAALLETASSKAAATACIQETTRISIPADIGEIRTVDRQDAFKVQMDVQKEFLRLFSQGLVAFSVEKSASSVDYLLAPASFIPRPALPPLAH